jgi:hypothetical protein
VKSVEPHDARSRHLTRQALLSPEVIDEYLDQDSPVWFIGAYVAQLDLAELQFERWNPAETGQPP